MARIAQLGIAIGALGLILTVMGLFPGLTGLEPTSGIGLIQVFVILMGMTLLILGALIYVKFTFYAFLKSTLMQQIGNRLALTGLVMAALAGLADVLGFGSHGIVIDAEETEMFLGRLQAVAIILSFFVSAFGVLVYAFGGGINDYTQLSDDTDEELPEELDESQELDDDIDE